ncbi:DUF938 domain-containing protein [Shewanella marina]|uniref:DUF938 domain-containing protein n=1 Tax=Shewanella marina TaxID=487319 RepID=UPI00055AC1B7|nr:DUF938 domain-containing protein [Shewanella marina]
MSIAQMAFSQACENNKQPILNQLESLLSKSKQVLEIGSGTGQHACFFAANMPWLTWHTSDRAINLPSLNARLAEQAPSNVNSAIELDITQTMPAISQQIDCSYSANTLHIMNQSQVETFFNRLGDSFPKLQQAIFYGPFNYQGQFTSASNQAFDKTLRERQLGQGIRYIEWIIELAGRNQLQLKQDIGMPANNRLLQFVCV